MKSEKECKERRKKLQIDLRATEKRFREYDNVDDMHLIDELQRAILEMDWVLNG